MDFINKLETMIGGWLKNVPHLPAAGQKWLATNVWWIVLIGAILTGIGLLFAIGGLFTLIALLGAVSSVYYVPGAGITAWSIIAAVIGLVFTVIQGILLAIAVQPLKAMQKKGWVILFASWLLGILSVVISAIVSGSIFGFISGILFGAIGVAISGYFLYEIHGQFAHVKTVKAKAKKA
ncbi:MAG: hypothetical protein WAV04_03495 [Candidatus Microsaccharimonas sp.]